MWRTAYFPASECVPCRRVLPYFHRTLREGSHAAAGDGFVQIDVSLDTRRGHCACSGVSDDHPNQRKKWGQKEEIGSRLSKGWKDCPM